jgi:hypothetical protein
MRSALANRKDVRTRKDGSMNMSFRLGFAGTLAILGACASSPSGGLDRDAGGTGGQNDGVGAVGNGGSSGSDVTPPSGDASAQGGSGTGNAGAGGIGATGGGGGGEGGAGGSGGGAGAGVSDAGGPGGLGKGSAFTCNQVVGVNATDDWFENGHFETLNGIANDVWQLKFRLHAYVSDWADPNSILWKETGGGTGVNAPAPIVSPCTTGSTDPDRVIFVAYDPTVTNEAGWEANLEKVVGNLVAKYTGLKEIDLFSMARAPDNKPCAGNTAHYVIVDKYIDDAIAATAAKHPGLVKVGPPYYVATCSGFTTNDTNLTASGSTAIANFFASLFGS